MTGLRVRSPYGKDVSAELQSVYGLADQGALVTVVRDALARIWGLRADIEEVHVAFGLAIRFCCGRERYYLKLASTSHAPAPERLFALLEHQRAQGVPAVEVLRTLGGQHHAEILPGTTYDLAYVMRAVRGTVMSRPDRTKLESYASTLAELHRVGESFRPRLARARNPLLAPSGLPCTHLHGDPRLCHVMFARGVVTGMIDPDTAEWGERIDDVARAAVSHSDPANAGLLDPPLIRAFVAAYDRRARLTEEEREKIPVALHAAVEEAISDVRHFHARNPERITEVDVARVLELRGVAYP